MGFWPFAWTWRTKRGGRVFVGGFILTPALLGLHWFWNTHQHQHQLPPPPAQQAWMGDTQQGKERGEKQHQEQKH